MAEFMDLFVSYYGHMTLAIFVLSVFGCIYYPIPKEGIMHELNLNRLVAFVVLMTIAWPIIICAAILALIAAGIAASLRGMVRFLRWLAGT